MEIADLLSKARNEKRGFLLYPEAKEFLDVCGIPTASSGSIAGDVRIQLGNPPSRLVAS